MGMYDELRREYPLTDGIVQDKWFQTKSFDCALDRYTITRDGRLILHQVRYEAVPEEERPYYGTPKWETMPFARMIGSLRSIPVGDIELPFHGDVIFYTSMGDGPDRERFEYRARFTEGRLQWLKSEKEGYR